MTTQHTCVRIHFHFLLYLGISMYSHTGLASLTPSTEINGKGGLTVMALIKAIQQGL